MNEATSACPAEGDNADAIATKATTADASEWEYTPAISINKETSSTALPAATVSSSGMGCVYAPKKRLRKAITADASERDNAPAISNKKTKHKKSAANKKKIFYSPTTMAKRGKKKSESDEENG